MKLTPGEGRELVLKKMEPLCFTGTLRDKKEEISIIADSEKREDL
jgi:hypothetical protein